MTEVVDFEPIRRRVTAPSLPPPTRRPTFFSRHELAQILSVPVDVLIGQHAPGASRRGPAPKLARHMERISQLPKPQQRFVMQVLESVLAQAGSR